MRCGATAASCTGCPCANDASVRRLKGPGRPLQTAEARAEVLGAIAHVDLVMVVDQDTPRCLIERLLADVLVKGAGYTVASIVGADAVITPGAASSRSNSCLGRITSAFRRRFEGHCLYADWEPRVSRIADRSATNIHRPRSLPPAPAPAPACSALPRRWGRSAGWRRGRLSQLSNQGSNQGSNQRLQGKCRISNVGDENLNPLEELKRLDQQVGLVASLEGLKPIYYRLDEIAKQYSNDFEVQLVVGDIKQHLVNRGTKLKEQQATIATPPASFEAQPSAPPPIPGTPPPPFAPQAAPPPCPWRRLRLCRRPFLRRPRLWESRRRFHPSRLLRPCPRSSPHRLRRCPCRRRRLPFHHRCRRPRSLRVSFHRRRRFPPARFRKPDRRLFRRLLRFLRSGRRLFPARLRRRRERWCLRRRKNRWPGKRRSSSARFSDCWSPSPASVSCSTGRA